MMNRVNPSLVVTIFAFLVLFMGQVQAITLREIMSSLTSDSPKAEQPLEGKPVKAIVAQKENPFAPQHFSNKAVEQKIQQEIQGKYGDNIEVRFASWRLPGGRSAIVSQFIVEEIEVNPQRTKTTALVHFQIGDQLKTLKIRGRLDHMINVPALNRPVHYGDLITKDDISWTKISGQKSNRFLITNPDDLIGRQPRAGFLKVNVPLYKRDVEFVRDIEKGSLVTAHYKTARLELLTKVRALEHGHKGESIRILNPDTNKILYGVVIGPGRVSLSPLPAVKN